MVAQDDIADAAIAVLQEPERHADRTYELTGPEALTLADVAETIGGGVRYHAESIDDAYVSRAHYQAPRWQVDAWVSTYTAIAAGELETVTGDVATLSGHPATSLRELLTVRGDG